MFGNETELRRHRDAVANSNPGQIRIIEQPEFVRDWSTAVRAIFSPANGVTDKERAGIVRAFTEGKFTPDVISLLEFETGRNFKFEILPILKSWVEQPLRDAEAALQRAEQEKRNVQLETKGKIQLKCGHFVDPTRIFKKADGLQITCFRCEKRYEAKLVIGREIK
jgi:hypothetical protein